MIFTFNIQRQYCPQTCLCIITSLRLQTRDFVQYKDGRTDKPIFVSLAVSPGEHVIFPFTIQRRSSLRPIFVCLVVTHGEHMMFHFIAI